MSTKKTALTMTDSERCFGESYDPDLPEDFPKSLKEENSMLKIIVEEQKTALDMIMRNYREQTDRLTKLSQVDLRKLHYQRYLNTIVNQANKMNKMSQTMRKNLLVILKYEELMREMEAENERLREIVRSLSTALRKSKAGAELKASLEVSSQTAMSAQESKAVGSDSPISRSPQETINEPGSSCTQVVPYVSIGYDSGYAVKSTTDPRPAVFLDDRAYEKFLAGFASSSISGDVVEETKEDKKLSEAPVTDLELFEDLSERIPHDFQLKGSEKSSKVCVHTGHNTSTSSENISTEEVYDDVQ